MRLWKKISDTEFDLLTVFSVKEVRYQPTENMPESMKGGIYYYVMLINGQTLQWTPEEKALFDREMDIHNETEKIIGAISSMQSSYVGEPIGG